MSPQRYRSPHRNSARKRREVTVLQQPVDIEIEEPLADTASHNEQIAGAVFGTLRTRDVPATLLGTIRAQLGARWASVWTPSAAGWCAAWTDAEPGARALAPVQLELQTLQIVRELRPLQGIGTEGEALLGHPLFSRNRLKGVLWLSRAPGAPFSEDDVSGLALPAATLSLAMDNLAVVEELIASDRQRDRQRIAFGYAEHHLTSLLSAPDLPEALRQQLSYAIEGVQRAASLGGEEE